MICPMVDILKPETLAMGLEYTDWQLRINSTCLCNLDGNVERPQVFYLQPWRLIETTCTKNCGRVLSLKEKITNTSRPKVQMFPIVHTWLPNGYHSFHVHGIRNT
jgi:hypothetical protein